jgi:two-component system, NtrC family, response regulator HydG
MEETTIMVVDDDTALAEGIADVLDAKGYNVYIANDGFEALDMVKKDNFEIVLMDIKMPVMNGVETYKRIKAVRPLVKVIMMTAYSTENLVDEAMYEGTVEVMNKPVDLDRLLALIEAIACSARAKM